MKKPASKAARTAMEATPGKATPVKPTPRKTAAKTPVQRRAASTGPASPRKADAADDPRSGEAGSAPRGAKHLLSAGIKALTTAHEEAVARQGRVFESLLGMRRDDAAPSSKPAAAPALDPFGFRKFEDVFDQRVAGALQHLGVPSAEAFAALQAEVESLRAQLGEAVAALQAARPRR